MLCRGAQRTGHYTLYRPAGTGVRPMRNALRCGSQLRIQVSQQEVTLHYRVEAHCRYAGTSCRSLHIFPEANCGFNLITPFALSADISLNVSADERTSCIQVAKSFPECEYIRP